MTGPGSLNDATSWTDAASRAPAGAALAGWIYEGERDLYRRLAQEMKSGQRFVEIGVYGGTTLALVALVAPKGVEVVAIDDFSNDTHEKGQRNNGVAEDKVVTLEMLCRQNLACAGVLDGVEPRGRSVVESADRLAHRRWRPQLRGLPRRPARLRQVGDTGRSACGR